MPKYLRGHTHTWIYDVHDEIEDMACEENKEDDAQFEEVPVVITEDDE